jgi:ABC-2 type transport system permease protein
MSEWMRLIRSENSKIYARRSTRAMIGCLIVLLFLDAGFDRFYAPLRASYWGAVVRQSWLVFFIGIFTAIVAGGSVANEFSWGTIKLLLIRPHRRGRILAAKYGAVLLFGLALTLLLLLGSLLLNGLLYGLAPATPGRSGLLPPEKTIFNSGAGVVLLYLLRGGEALVYGSIAFMLSALSRSVALATGVTFFAMLLGPQLDYLLGAGASSLWLFSQLDLPRYIRPGLTAEPELWFALGVIAAYLALFYSVAWLAFTQRDVLE